ncbi:hypothetical protein FJT64_023808 [Amphibalanus amphitrite]|uniref:Uncharacterized protein n=1 Tax=Amphibalanus amphitrite TaxID=1232801 RepID=A0A6A4WKQ5_AMPAM|nr:hypothetical protein FJT64_023808 [Amphibalanus amphitrite]
MSRKTALECSAQMSASQRCTPLTVSSGRSEMPPNSDGPPPDIQPVRRMLEDLAQQAAPPGSEVQQQQQQT